VRKLRKIHMAGVIPVSGIETDMETVYPEVILSIDKGYTAIQKSVFECAMAGCSTIWIVANEDLAPIVRKVVGDWIYDPVYMSRLHFGEGNESRKEIPIFYCPIHPKDVGRRDSYGWSILNGVYSAWKVGNEISKWLIPEKYYISFPMSIFNIYDIRAHRSKISDRNANFLMSYEGKTVLDNVPLSFTMFNKDYINCRRSVNKATTKDFYNTEEGEIYPSRRLPLKERWSAKSFSLNQVLSELDTTDAFLYNVDWYGDLSTWQGYLDYLSSENLFKKPHELLTKPHRHANIPYNA